MPTYTDVSLLGDTDEHGTTVAHGTRNIRAAETHRLPAFLALAAHAGGGTGAVYAENAAGMTVHQALAAAGLDFTVEKHAGLTVDLPTGGSVTGLDKMRATVAHYADGRQPTMLGVVGKGYEIIQPGAAANFGQAVLEEGGATVAAAAAYGDPVGSRMYLALKLPEGLNVGGEDPHDLYLTIGNSWDRSTGLWACIAPIRLMCTNQFTATFGRMSNRFTIRHTGDVGTKITEVQRALTLTGTFSQQYARTAEKLLATPMVGAEIDAFLHKLLPTPTGLRTERGEQNWEAKRSEIATVIRHGERNTTGRGTRYAALHGVIEWADWMAPARTEVRRYTRMVDGGQHEQIKNDAARLLLAGV